MSKIYPSIPDPQPTLESVTETVRILKAAVELLTAQRGAAAAAHVFVQSTTPVAIHLGDIWIDKQNNSIIRYWTGEAWTKITIA